MRKPDAWQWLDTANFRKSLPERAKTIEWHALYALTPAEVEMLERVKAGTHVCVPREPTPDMCIQGGIAGANEWHDSPHTWVDVVAVAYTAMLAAVSEATRMNGEYT